MLGPQRTKIVSMTQSVRAALTLIVLCLVTSGCMSPLCWEDLYFHKDNWYWPKMSMTSKCTWCHQPLHVDYRLQGYCYRVSSIATTNGPFQYTWIGPCRLVHVSEGAKYEIPFDGPACSTEAALTYSRDVELRAYQAMKADRPFCSQGCLQAYKAASEKAPSAAQKVRR